MSIGPTDRRGLISAAEVRRRMADLSSPVLRAPIQQQHAPDGAARPALDGAPRHDQRQCGDAGGEHDHGDGYAHADCPLIAADALASDIGDIGILAAVGLGFIIAVGASFAMWAGWL